MNTTSMQDLSNNNKINYEIELEKFNTDRDNNIDSAISNGINSGLFIGINTSINTDKDSEKIND